MIKYILAANIGTEPHHHKFQNIRELSEKEMKRFSDSVDALTPFNKTYTLFEICEENFRAIENYFQELSLLTGGNQLTWHMVTIKWNTLTLNYLASFRLFVDHHETTLERDDDPVKSSYDKFKERTAHHYDTYFSYRFLWNLRNYIQHCGLPACSWHFSEIKEEPNKARSQVEIAYDRDGMLNGFAWKKLKAELESLPSSIDVITLIRELNSSIGDITQYTANLHILKLQEPLNYLIGLLNEVISKYPSAEPEILKWEVQEESGITPKFLGLLPFPLRIMTNIREIRT